MALLIFNYNSWLQLPPNTTWQMLRDKFQDAGEVKFAEMRGADMGMVRFASEWDAERAVSILFKARFRHLLKTIC